MSPPDNDLVCFIFVFFPDIFKRVVYTAGWKSLAPWGRAEICTAVLTLAGAAESLKPALLIPQHVFLITSLCVPMSYLEHLNTSVFPASHVKCHSVTQKWAGGPLKTVKTYRTNVSLYEEYWMYERICHIWSHALWQQLWTRLKVCPPTSRSRSKSRVKTTLHCLAVLTS